MRRCLAEFTCHLTGAADAVHYWVPFRISLPFGGSFTYSVKIGNRPSVKPIMLPETVLIPEPEAMSACGKALLLDRVEQAVIGRPSKLASLQEDYFWGGKDELSAQTWIGYNLQNLMIAVKVHDANPKLPVNWPDIRGACVELFFDFRAPEQGLGSPYYGDKVYQFLVRPALTANAQPLVYSPQLTDSAKVGVTVFGKTLGSHDYWIGLSIPWRLVNKDGKPSNTFGFDVGVNGAYPNKAERKTQLMLFGTARNFSDASAFGAAVIE